MRLERFKENIINRMEEDSGFVKGVIDTLSAELEDWGDMINEGQDYEMWVIVSSCRHFIMFSMS